MNRHCIIQSAQLYEGQLEILRERFLRSGAVPRNDIESILMMMCALSECFSHLLRSFSTRILRASTAARNDSLLSVSSKTSSDGPASSSSAMESKGTANCFPNFTTAEKQWSEIYIQSWLCHLVQNTQYRCCHGRKLLIHCSRDVLS